MGRQAGTCRSPPTDLLSPISTSVLHPARGSASGRITRLHLHTPAAFGTPVVSQGPCWSISRSVSASTLEATAQCMPTSEVASFSWAAVGRYPGRRKRRRSTRLGSSACCRRAARLPVYNVDPRNRANRPSSGSTSISCRGLTDIVKSSSKPESTGTSDYHECFTIREIPECRGVRRPPNRLIFDGTAETQAGAAVPDEPEHFATLKGLRSTTFLHADSFRPRTPGYDATGQRSSRPPLNGSSRRGCGSVPRTPAATLAPNPATHDRLARRRRRSTSTVPFDPAGADCPVER